MRRAQRVNVEIAELRRTVDELRVACSEVAELTVGVVLEIAALLRQPPRSRTEFDARIDVIVDRIREQEDAAGRLVAAVTTGDNDG